jgi:LPS sulfotransferase NodH
VNRRRFLLERSQQRQLALQRPIFVVFGTQRSGSTLVASRLNSHPRVVCHEEVLLPGVDSGPSLTDWMIANRYPPWLRGLPSVRLAFLDSLVSSDPGIDIGAIGMKIMYDQISLWPKLSYVLPRAGKVCHDASLLRWMERQQVIIVHTLRRNHLKMIISHALAARTGKFHSRNSVHKTGSRISLPLRGLTMRLRRIEVAEEVARDAIRNLRSFEVWYEDYVGPERDSIEARLCSAIGLRMPDSGLRSPLTKVTNDKLTSTITNYSEVVRCLSGTRFERFLND